MTFTLSPQSRRAMLLGLPLAIAGCDLVSFVLDPRPILEQTWNIPADTARISVADIVPNGITIYSAPGTSDSSAFQVTIASVPAIARTVGADCASCVTLNGTTAIKPAFTLATGSATTLPTNVVSAALVGGQVNISITNGMSFDPLRVKTIAPASTNPTQQGRLVIVLRSGSLVVGRDSLNGVTTAFAPGAVLMRQIPLQSGNIGSAFAIDLTLTSPASDNAVFINANSGLSATASVPDMRVAQVGMNVVNETMSTTTGDSIPLSGFGKDVTHFIVGGGLDVTTSNPFNIAGNLTVNLGYAQGQAVTKAFTIASGTGLQQIVALTSDDMEKIFSADKIAVSVTGSVNSTGPITVTPKQQIVMVNRLILTIRTPE